MNFPIEFSVIKFDLTTWLGGLYLLAIAVSYYLIFRKHHKRNHVEIFELVNLVTKYFVITTISILSLYIAFFGNIEKTLYKYLIVF